MPEISFYQLTSTALEKALPALLDRIVSSNMKALVLAKSEAQIKALDESIWTYSSPKFLPHTTVDNEDVDEHPIFLTREEVNPIAAEVLVAVEGLEPAYIAQFDRVVDMFDGRVEAELAGARQRWKRYKDAGHSVTYWQQEANGAWKKAA